jgi:hypothetical protein
MWMSLSLIYERSQLDFYLLSYQLTSHDVKGLLGAPARVRDWVD